MITSNFLVVAPLTQKLMASCSSRYQSCHGNFADDPPPFAGQRHGKSQPSQTITEALFGPELVECESNIDSSQINDGHPTLLPSDGSPLSPPKTSSGVDKEFSASSSLKVEEMMDDTVVLPTSSLAPDDDPLPVISEDVPAQSSLKGSSLRDDANGTESRGNVEDATSHLPSSARDDSLTKDVLESLAMKDSDRVEVPQLLDTGSSLPPNAISSGAARQDLPVGQTSSELFAKEAAVEVGTPAKLENLELTSKLQLSVRDMGMDDPISPYEILEGNGNGLLPEASVVLDQQSNIGLESDSNELLSGNEALPTEDMPSFSEWAKKQLEEQVKHGQHSPSSSSQQAMSVGKHLRHKNYASVDCGAKVIGANPEAQSTSAVLSHFRDDYMLNPCTAKIWLVIELCESIQVHRLDLANFELYSSSPRKFAVYSSDRFPTRDWIFLGVFEAKDEKNEQNFTLTHHSFSKYIKIEMESHYGSEHFCPLSLVRVFGTSEFEALETEDRREGSASRLAHESDGLFSDEDEEDLLDDQSPPSSTQESQNLFGSAKDAVMNMMKKAAEVLRSDKSDSAIGGKPDDKKDSKETEAMTVQNERKGCMCLARLPIPDGGLPVERKCQKEQSVAFLSCSYSSLLDFMSNSWNVPVQGRFSDQCSSFCQSYVKDCDCDVTSEEHALPVIFDTHPLTCRFFNAILEPARFGALCLLDKLILDIQQQKTYMTSRCPFSNATLEQSSTNLNTVEVPSVTPVAVVKTASSHMYTVEPLPSNACDSGDGRILCSTIAVRTVDVKDASSAPVIKTGKIVASETKGVVEDGGGTTSNISLITPTRTLESGEKFTTPQTQATDTTGVHCQSAGTEKTDSEAISKMISPDADCSRHSLDNIRGDDTDETPSDGRDLHIDSIVTELKAPQSSSKSGESVVPAKSLSQAEGPIKDKDTSADSLVTKDDDNLQPLMSPQSKIVIGGGSTTTTASFSSSPFVRDAPVAIASSLHSSDTEGGSSDDQGSLAFSSHGTVAQSPSVLLSLSSSRLDFGVTNTTGIIGNGLGKQQQQQLPVGAPPNGLVAGQKESVFVRLSNRIKSLELNMSLSGQYLEELSRRYRKQMEEMQRAFNKTISALNDTARKAYERDLKQQELIMTLQVQLDGLSKVVLDLKEQQEGLHSTVISRHIFLMLVEALVMAAVFMTCNRSPGQMVATVSGQTRTTTSDRSSGRRCVVAPAIASSSAIQQLRRNSDSSIKPLTYEGAMEESKERRKSSTEAPTSSEVLCSQTWVVERRSTIDRIGSREFDHPPKKKKRQRNSNNGTKSQEQGKGNLVRSLSSGVLLSSNTQSKGLPPSSSSSSSSSISLNVHSVRKSPSVDTSASKSGNPLRELSNFRIDDLVNGGGLQSSALRSSVNCVASLPLLKTCSGPTDSMRCPLTNLMYGGYAPELPDKCQDSTARSCGHFGLLHQQQPSHCQNGDDFVLKKELQKACR